MPGGFQTAVTTQPAPAVAGDFCDHNPRFSVNAGPGGLVAGPSGVTVGTFAWVLASSIDADGFPAIVTNNLGSGPVAGFVHREQQALITTYLANAGMLIQPGFQMGLMSGGGFWAKNSGTGIATVGMKAYATFGTGLVTGAATGAPSTFTAATSTIAAATALSATGSISGNVLTLTNIASGLPQNGAIITGSGVATGSQIVSQLTGTALGVGTYALNIGDQSVASEAIAGTYGVLTLGATPSGVFVPGGVLSGGTTAAGTTLWALLTGSPGVSGATFVVSPSQAVTSSTQTLTTNVETKWVIQSVAQSGELMKIVSQPLG